MAQQQRPWFMPKTTEVAPEDLADVTNQEEVDAEDRIDEFVDSNNRPLSEVQMRLEKARYYQLLIDQALFTDNTSAGNEVLGEIRAFVIHRMNVLVGLEHEKQVVTDVFDDDEITALKAMASRVLGRTSVQPVVVPTAPSVRPAVVAPAPSVRPVTPPAAPKVATPPAPKPVEKKRQPRPPKKAEAPKPEAPAPVSNGTASDEPIHFPRVRSIEDVDIEALPWDQKIIVGNKMYKVQDDGSGNRTWRDITPVARPEGVQPIPMPTAEAMEHHQMAEADKITRRVQNQMQSGQPVGTNDTIGREP